MIKFALKTAAIAALLSSTSAIAATSGWSISEASGKVEIVREGKRLAGRKGMRLDEGDVITTATKSRAVITRGSEYVVVSPKAKIKIADPEKAGPVTQIFQYLGNALFKIEKKSTPHFGVETPYMAAVVKGTTFNVSVSQEGTSVQVTEGAVEVITPDDLEAALLTPGIIGIVEADQIGDLIVVVGDSENIDREKIMVRGAPNLVASLNRANGDGDVQISVSEDQTDRGSQGSANRADPGQAPGLQSGTNETALNIPDFRDDGVTEDGVLAALGAEGDDDASNELDNDFAATAEQMARNEPDSDGPADPVDAEDGDGDEGGEGAEDEGGDDGDEGGEGAEDEGGDDGDGDEGGDDGDEGGEGAEDEGGDDGDGDEGGDDGEGAEGGDDGDEGGEGAEDEGGDDGEGGEGAEDEGGEGGEGGYDDDDDDGEGGEGGYDDDDDDDDGESGEGGEGGSD